MNRISIKNLSFWYKPEKKILNDINLEISENEFTAIIGENGSGKTTLLKNICGLLRPAQGNIFLDGKNISEFCITDLSKKIGYVMQEYDNQLFEFSVFDEVAFSLKGESLPKEEIRSKVEDMLAAVGLAGKSESYPLSLGRAGRVKTVLASILVMGPKIIILDEPAAGLDFRNCRLIMEIVKKLHGSGYAVILVSHNMNIVAEYAQRVIVMHNGGIFMDGKPPDVFSRAGALSKAGIIPPQITVLSQLLMNEIPLEKNALSPGELAGMVIACKNA